VRDAARVDERRSDPLTQLLQLGKYGERTLLELRRQLAGQYRGDREVLREPVVQVLAEAALLARDGGDQRAFQRLALRNVECEHQPRRMAAVIDRLKPRLYGYESPVTRLMPQLQRLRQIRRQHASERLILIRRRQQRDGRLQQLAAAVAILPLTGGVDDEKAQARPVVNP